MIYFFFILRGVLWSFSYLVLLRTSFPCLDNFLFKSTFFLIDLDYIFRTWKINVIFITDIFQRLLHNHNIEYYIPPYLVINFLIVLLSLLSNRLRFITFKNQIKIQNNHYLYLFALTLLIYPNDFFHFHHLSPFLLLNR